MPTKRVALLACLTLLAACSPRAADGGGEAAAPAAPAAQQAPDAVTATVPAIAPPPADPGSGDGNPTGTAPVESDVNVDCDVPGVIGDPDDHRIYCAMPADVRAFIERENTCQHFAGEEPYDAQRRKELEDAMDEVCSDRERRFAALYATHHDDCVIRHAMIGFGNRYDLFTDVAPDYCRPQDVR
ncbi:hypothetical protein [Stenotrophomonas sp.]|uniref:hypothetical protein n=1 Tax=Stenotrophomonas sp. TaxID=69392 RepID=UPI002FC816A2